MSPTGSDAIFELRDGDLSVRVGTRGGALYGASFRGINFLVAGGGPDGDMVNFPLVPFGNRLEHNSFDIDGTAYRFQPNSKNPLYLHGDGWLERWSVDAKEPSSITLSLRRGADTVSPYDYLAEQTIAVAGDSLTLDLSVRNEGDITLPFGLGHHPFFVRTDETRLRARTQSYWTEREGHLPGHPTPIPAELDFSSGAALPDRFVNNALAGWDGQASITWPELRIAADIEASPIYDIAMVYMPITRLDFFCFEPMTHLPNGHHMPGFGGLKRLGRGESMTARMTIRMRTL